MIPPWFLIAVIVASASPERQRGVSWVAGRPVTAEGLQPLSASHVNWIVQTPFGWQRGMKSPTIRLATTGGVLWGETDEGLRVTAELARARGIRTLLKPHIWISGGGWRGEIDMDGDDAWAAWFDSYRRFIVHYARLAEAHDMEALCIGTELRSTLGAHEDEWRQIIAEVKAVYGGKLTYAANWYAEYEEVPFWDELDFIGIQAYFPLSENERPTLEDLIEGWKVHVPRLKRLSRKHGKPVVFTELGYRSTAGSASRPWEWPRRGAPARVDLQVQADCYQAFFRTFWDEPWFAGVYWWKWFPRHAAAGGPEHAGFTPQNKPAEKILAEWYGRTSSRDEPPDMLE